MSMMDSDFDAWFQSLGPEDQAFVLQQLGLADPFAPALSDQSYDLASFGEFAPDYNSRGEALPFGLDQMGQVLTQQKNRNSLLADNITGALAGPGAYGPDAFVPQYQFDGPVVEQPGRQMASYYAGMGGGGFQALIADEILNGSDPSTAVAKVLQLAQMPDSESLTPELRAQRDAIVASLQPARAGGGATLPSEQANLTDAQKFAQQYDVEALYSFANDLGAKIAADPTAAAGYEDPATGTIYQNAPEEMWSGAAQKFLDLGLPFPTAQYTDAEYGQPLLDQDRLAQLYAAEQESQRLTAAAPSAATVNDMEGLLGAYEAEAARRATPVAGQMRMQDDDLIRNIGPVAARATSPADQFRRFAAEDSLQQPSFWVGKDGQTQTGDPGVGISQALLNFDFTGMGNAAIAEAGGQTDNAGRLTSNVVNRYKGQQEQARKARSRRMDLSATRTQGERDAATQLGQQLAMRAQGRTPLQDAMMQRLLTNRAQGLY